MAKKEHRTEKAKNKYVADMKKDKKELTEIKKPNLHQKEHNHYKNKEIMCMKPVDMK